MTQTKSNFSQRFSFFAFGKQDDTSSSLKYQSRDADAFETDKIKKMTRKSSMVNLVETDKVKFKRRATIKF